MNGISHKHAVQLIYRRMDGMLNESQRLQLEEHLRSCESCQAHAADMDGLSAHLQNEFHRRWGEQTGPSQNVFDQVTTQAIKLPIRNRIVTGTKLFAGAVALIALAFVINFLVSQLQSTAPATNPTETVDHITLPENPLLAFASDESGNSDIYTMHADGSERTNITNNSAYDGNPSWSPDGKRIAFVSDRDGFNQVYLMNADGSELTQLTHDESHHYLPVNIHGESNPWSPDGTQLLFLQQELDAETSTLYTLDISSGKVVRLADGNVQFNNLSWSPDGKYIGYVLNISPAPDARFETGLYVIDATGSNLISLHELVPDPDVIDSPAYHWSRDGSSIIFIAYRHLDETSHQWIAYEAVLESQQLIERATSSTRMQDWWEGTSFISGDTAILTWLRSDGTFNTFKPLEACQSPGDGPYGFYAKRSPQGSQVINISCPNDVMWFYYSNADGTIIKPLMSSPIPSTTVDHSVTAMTWSSDDRFIAAAMVSPTKSSFYILNVNEPAAQPQEIVISNAELYAVPSWQPVGNHEIVEQEPTPEPPASDRLIAFTAAGESGEPDIFTTLPDGTGLTNITNHPAQDLTPTWSPDGKRIAFVSDRDGNENIYVMNADGSELIQVTDDPAPEFGPVWSPDSTKIAYLSGNFSKRETNIYVMDSDGQNRHPVTEYAPGNLILSIQWSPDSQHIFFNINSSIRQANVSGGESTRVTPDTVADVSSYTLTKDGSKLLYLTPTCSTSGQNNSDLCYTVRTIHVDGTKEETLATMNYSEICSIKQTDAWMGLFPRWSPDLTKLVFLFTCEEEGWIYIANADGSDFKPLTNYPILGNGPENEVATADWSPDSQSIIFMSALGSPESEDLFHLKVSDALQNPALLPSPLNISVGQISSPAWQPVSSHEIVEQEPTPAPPASDRLIAFTSPQDGTSEIFVMNTDGSGVQNITSNPATDRNPVWSPDGTKIAFESDRNGKFDVFVMNADGSNLTQITADLVYDVLANSYDSPWSPDGTRLVIQSNISGHEALFVVSADGKGEPIQISETPGFVTWSPVGDQIAYSYISEKSGLNNTGEHDAIRIVNADGSHGNTIWETGLIRNVHWSADGTMLYYLNGWNIERADDMGGTPETILSIEPSDFPNLAWFGPDATIVYQSTDPDGRYSSLYRFESGESSLIGLLSNQDMSEACNATPKDHHAIPGAVVSHDTKQAISYINCGAEQVVFTLHDLTNNKSILTSKVLGTLTLVNPEVQVTWSQDDQVVTIRTVQSDVSQSSGAQASLYVLHRSQLGQTPAALTPVITQINGLTRTAIQPISNRESPAPTPEPTQVVEPERSLPLGTDVGNGEWIAFIGSTMTSDPMGSAGVTDLKDVYLIHPDGSGLVNLTNAPDDYFWPTWSPNGKHLLVLRNAGTVDILRRTEPASFEVLVSTEMSAVLKAGTSSEKPISYSWSPNSEQIAFLDHRAGNYDIYTVYADGRNDLQRKQLTNDPAPEFGFVWSPDGSQIAYQKTNDEQLSIMVMNADGSNPREVAHGMGEVSLRWSMDGNIIYAHSVYQWPPESTVSHLACEGCSVSPAIYQINLNDGTVRQIYDEEDASQVDGWYVYDTPQNTLYFMRVKPQSFLGTWGTWFRADGNSLEELEELDPHQTCQTTAGNILNEHISPNPRFSIISNFCAGGFDLYLADREAPNPEQKLLHLLRLPLNTWGQGGDDATLPVTWSPDGRWLVYDDGRGVIYLLDIERAIQDPDAALTPLIEPVYYTGANGLQYQSSETITVQNLVWQPAP